MTHGILKRIDIWKTNGFATLEELTMTNDIPAAINNRMVEEYQNVVQANTKPGDRPGSWGRQWPYTREKGTL